MVNHFIKYLIQNILQEGTIVEALFHLFLSHPWPKKCYHCWSLSSAMWMKVLWEQIPFQFIPLTQLKASTPECSNCEQPKRQIKWFRFKFTTNPFLSRFQLSLHRSAHSALGAHHHQCLYNNKEFFLRGPISYGSPTRSFVLLIWIVRKFCYFKFC